MDTPDITNTKQPNIYAEKYNLVLRELAITIRNFEEKNAQCQRLKQFVKFYQQQSISKETPSFKTKRFKIIQGDPKKKEQRVVQQLKQQINKLSHQCKLLQQENTMLKANTCIPQQLVNIKKESISSYTDTKIQSSQRKCLKLSAMADNRQRSYSLMKDYQSFYSQSPRNIKISLNEKAQLHSKILKLQRQNQRLSDKLNKITNMKAITAKSNEASQIKLLDELDSLKKQNVLHSLQIFKLKNQNEILRQLLSPSTLDMQIKNFKQKINYLFCVKSDSLNYSSLVQSQIKILKQYTVALFQKLKLSQNQQNKLYEQQELKNYQINFLKKQLNEKQQILNKVKRFHPQNSQTIYLNPNVQTIVKERRRTQSIDMETPRSRSLGRFFTQNPKKNKAQFAQENKLPAKLKYQNNINSQQQFKERVNLVVDLMIKGNKLAKQLKQFTDQNHSQTPHSKQHKKQLEMEKKTIDQIIETQNKIIKNYKELKANLIQQSRPSQPFSNVDQKDQKRTLQNKKSQNDYLSQNTYKLSEDRCSLNVDVSSIHGAKQQQNPPIVEQQWETMHSKRFLAHHKGSPRPGSRSNYQNRAISMTDIQQTSAIIKAMDSKRYI